MVRHQTNHGADEPEARAVASRRVGEGAREIKLREKISVPGAAWLAARCFSNLGPTTNWELKVVAHTSPAYLKAPGQEFFSADAAAYLLTLIEGARTWVETIATRPARSAGRASRSCSPTPTTACTSTAPPTRTD